VIYQFVVGAVETVIQEGVWLVLVGGVLLLEVSEVLDHWEQEAMADVLQESMDNNNYCKIVLKQ